MAGDHLGFVDLNKVGKMYTSVTLFKFFGSKAANVSAFRKYLELCVAGTWAVVQTGFYTCPAVVKYQCEILALLKVVAKPAAAEVSDSCALTEVLRLPFSLLQCH